MPGRNAHPYTGTAEDSERDMKACEEAMEAYADAMAEAGVALSHIYDMPTYETACMAYNVAYRAYEKAKAKTREAEIAIWRRFPEKGEIPIPMQPEPPEKPQEDDYE